MIGRKSMLFKPENFTVIVFTYKIETRIKFTFYHYNVILN